MAVPNADTYSALSCTHSVLSCLDALVEAAELAGQAGSLPARWLIAQSPRLAIVAGHEASRARRPKAPTWTPEEDRFLEVNLGYLSEEEIARELGRTRLAVHLRWERDLRLPCPSKTPGWITPTRVAHSLGIDGHCVMRLVRAGILPADPLPWLNHGVYLAYRLRLVTFYRWAINPRHWIYFRRSGVRDPHLRRLLERQAQRWDDAWLTPGQVADMHGVDHRDVNRFIRAGKLPAVQWGNWRILHSDAERVHFTKGRGSGHVFAWSPGADAFMLLARAIGLSTNAIPALVHLPSQTVCYRLQALRADPAEVARLAQAYGLALQINAAGQLFANWRHYRHRFPALARAMDRFAAVIADPTSRIASADLLRVRGVLWAWATWHAATDEQRSFAQELSYSRHATRRYLLAAYAELRSWGVDPLAPIQEL